MKGRGEIKPLTKVGRGYLYEAAQTAAGSTPIEAGEALMEVYPYSALSHWSALAYHGLTDAPPRTIAAIVLVPRIQGIQADPSDDFLAALKQSRKPSVLPCGTTPSDWEGLTRWEGIPWVSGLTPPRILDWDVEWDSSGRFFGVHEYRRLGYPVYVTSPEKTLVDALQKPQLCSGIENVLRAWAVARDTLNADELVQTVDRFDIGVLRQRVGFILDELGLSHPTVEGWRARAQRGGSSRLLASAPYASTYSERWNLSINTPVTALHDARTPPRAP